MTGWNMPPGCNASDIPGNEDATCEVCFKTVDDCICRECPVCGELGNIKCYSVGDPRFPADQHMEPTREIVLARCEEEVRRAEQNLVSCKEVLQELRDSTQWDPADFDITDDGLS